MGNEWIIDVETGLALPMLSAGSGTVYIQTAVDGARNAQNEMRGAPVGKDKMKIDAGYAALGRDEFRQALMLFDREQGGRFVREFRVYDPRYDDFVNRLFYVGDRQGRPYIVDKLTSKPNRWLDIRMNLIEV